MLMRKAHSAVRRTALACIILAALPVTGCETGRNVALRVVDAETGEGIPAAKLTVHHYSPDLHVTLTRKANRPVFGRTDADGIVNLFVYDTATGWTLDIKLPYVGGTVGEPIAPAGTHLPAPRTEPSPDPTVPDVALEPGTVGNRSYDALILVRKQQRP